MEQSENMERNRIYYIGLLLVAVAWGSNFAVSRLGMESFDPVLFTFLRFGLSVPLFFLLLRAKEGSVGVTLPDGLRLALIGLLGVTLLEIAVMYSIKFTTLANSSLLNVAPWPIFAALFAPLFVSERLTGRVVAGGAAAMAGVVLVIAGGEGGFDLSSSNMTGNLLAFGVSIVGALYNLASMPLMSRYSALRVTSWTVLFGSLFMFPLTLGSWHKVAWTALSAGELTAILYNVLICTVAAFLVWNGCMYRVGAARANFFRYAVPAAAVAAGVLFYDETITLPQAAGAACMAAGLLWISLDKIKTA